jgi:hypothetical protein
VVVTADVGSPVAEANHRAIPIDAGVPDGSVLLGPVKEITNSIF